LTQISMWDNLQDPPMWHAQREMKPKLDQILLTQFYMMPERFMIMDFEGKTMPAGTVTSYGAVMMVHKGHVEYSGTVYFSDTQEFTVKTLGWDTRSYFQQTQNGFRAWIKTWADRGYKIFAKGLGWEFFFLNDLNQTTSVRKDIPLRRYLKKQQTVAEMSEHEAVNNGVQWAFAVHELVMMKYDQMRTHYMFQIPYKRLQKMERESNQLGLSRAVHMPLREIWTFFLHWKFTTQDLFTKIQYAIFYDYYRAPLVDRDMDIDLYESLMLGRTAKPLYWDRRLYSIPHQKYMLRLVYTSPEHVIAIDRMCAFRSAILQLPESKASPLLISEIGRFSSVIDHVAQEAKMTWWQYVSTLEQNWRVLRHQPQIENVRCVEQWVPWW